MSNNLGSIYGVYKNGKTHLIIESENVEISGNTNIINIDASFTNLDVSENLLILGSITTRGQIHGPSTLIIDPESVGDNTGMVVIKGGLQVDGSSTIINSSILDISDHRILLATSAPNSAAAHGAGIEISGNKKLTYNATKDVFESNIDLSASGINTTTLRATNIDLSLQSLLDTSNAHFTLINTNTTALAATDLSIAHIVDTSNAHFTLINANSNLLSATQGTALASKALIVDENKDIKGLRSLEMTGDISASGSLKVAGLNEGSQVKALYYNTTTGEITYDNSGGGGGSSGGSTSGISGISGNIISGSDASFTNVDISKNLKIENLFLTSGRINFFQSNSQAVNTDPSGIINRLDILDNSINNLTTGKDIVNSSNQSYFDLTTTQPNQFDSSGVPTFKSSSKINIEWNYDNIIPKTNNVYHVMNNIASVKQRQLPFINKIIFEISGSGLSNTSTGWIELSNVTIPDDLSYNQNKFKIFNFIKQTQNINTDVESILSKLDTFSVRIYGENYANNYPTIDNRALYFNDLSFNLAAAPSQPVFINGIYSSHKTIIADFSVVYIENLETITEGKLKTAETSYNLVETLRSVKYDSSVDNSVLLDSETLSTNNTIFRVILNNLFSGSKYDIITKVNNDLNEEVFSISSEIIRSEYTLLPTSNGIGTIINSNIASNYKFITTSSSTSNLNNSNSIYINLAANNTLIYSNSENQFIELTKPYSINQRNETKGFGKFIDNSSNLINLKVSVNNILKQTLSFDGCFNTIASNNYLSNSNTFSFVTGGNIEDIYSDIKDKGFRLKSNIRFNSMTSSNILDYIGDASTNAYTLKYEYIRNSDVGGSNSTNTYIIYIDNYSQIPNISSKNNSGFVINVQYNMGIPSVDKFFLNMTRTYSNINSQYMYINGNNLISNIGSIINTSATSSKNLILTNGEIVSNGIYSFTNTKMNNKTSNYYTNLHYTSNRLTKNNSISWNETIYNIYTSNSQILSLTINHYCDYNSFNKSGSSINTSKLVLSNTIFWEINNINNLGSNMRDLSFSQYTNHENLVKDSTLLFISGNFRTNNSINYPNVNDFSYNGITISNFYSSGKITYELTGISNGNNGYKWIGFKFSMASDKSSHNFGGSVYNYLNIYQLLTAIPISFSSNILTKLKLDGGLGAASNNEVVGFIQQEYGGSNRIGRLDRDYKSTELWYAQDSNKSYNTMFQGVNRANYGSIYNENSTNWGPILDINNGNDNIYIFIGMKNNVSLV